MPVAASILHNSVLPLRGDVQTMYEEVSVILRPIVLLCEQEVTAMGPAATGEDD